MDEDRKPQLSSTQAVFGTYSSTQIHQAGLGVKLLARIDTGITREEALNPIHLDNHEWKEARKWAAAFDAITKGALTSVEIATAVRKELEATRHEDPDKRPSVLTSIANAHPTVHLIHRGLALCGYHPEQTPKEWATDQVWTGIDDAHHANCTPCLEALKAQRAATTEQKEPKKVFNCLSCGQKMPSHIILYCDACRARGAP